MIAVIDYGAGNIFSVKNALNFLGLEGELCSEPDVIRKADKIILPGVGAFPDAMSMLEERGLVEVVKEEAQKKPLLGICLGMQILFEKGYEFEETPGLGLIEGYVDKLIAPGKKIPHIGWNDTEIINKSPLIKDMKEGDMVYFVHSYKAVTADENISLKAHYGQDVPALVFRENVYGTQFHPEKSGEVGLNILKNFAAL